MQKIGLKLCKHIRSLEKVHITNPSALKTRQGEAS